MECLILHENKIFGYIRLTDGRFTRHLLTNPLPIVPHKILVKEIPARIIKVRQWKHDFHRNIFREKVKEVQTDQKTGAQAADPMTGEEVLTCAINIGEQLLVSGAEISRVEDTIQRICNAYGIRQSHIFSIASCIIVTLETKERQWITQTRRILSYGTDMWKLDRLNDLSRRICATQPSFDVIDQEYEKILKGPTYSPAAQCAIYAMTAGAFAVFFGEISGTVLRPCLWGR